MNKKSVFDQLAQLSFLPLYTKVLTASLQLDVYSHLSADISAKDLAAKLGWNESNTAYFLEGLTSIGFVVESIPQISTLPEVGSVNPSIIRIVVDFPAPFGPNNPKISPLQIDRLIWSTAVKLPYFLVKSVSTITCSPIITSFHIFGIGNRHLPQLQR